MNRTLPIYSVLSGGCCQIIIGVLVFPKKDVVFEFKDLIHRETDWLYLYLGVLCLLKMSHGLRHRQRILEILTSMHHVFEGLKEE